MAPCRLGSLGRLVAQHLEGLDGGDGVHGGIRLLRGTQVRQFPIGHGQPLRLVEGTFRPEEGGDERLESHGLALHRPGLECQRAEFDVRSSLGLRETQECQVFQVPVYSYPVLLDPLVPQEVDETARDPAGVVKDGVQEDRVMGFGSGDGRCELEEGDVWFLSHAKGGTMFQIEAERSAGGEVTVDKVLRGGCGIGEGDVQVVIAVPPRRSEL